MTLTLNDTYTIRAMRYLALIWYARNKRSEALSLMLKVVSLSDEMRTPSHPISISCRNALTEWLSEAQPPSPMTNSINELNKDSPKCQEWMRSASDFQKLGHFGGIPELGPFDNIAGLKESLYKGKITRAYVEQKIAFYTNALNDPKPWIGPGSYNRTLVIFLELLTEYALL